MLTIFLLSCTPHMKPSYMQDISNISWSSDGESLYFSYYTHLDPDRGTFNSYFYKIEIASGNITELYHQEGEIALLIDIDPKTEQIVTEHSSEMGLIGIKNKHPVKLSNVKSGRYGQFVDAGKQFLAQGQPDGTENYSLGLFNLIDGSFSSLNISPNLLSKSDDFFRVAPDSLAIYFSNRKIHSGATDSTVFLDTPDSHFVGTLDILSKKVLNLKAVAVPTGQKIRFRGWLSPDEILFSRLDENSNYLSIFIYHLTTGASQELSDWTIFWGSFSPDSKWVARVIEGDLVLSAPTGSSKRVLIDVENRLPKGASLPTSPMMRLF